MVGAGRLGRSVRGTWPRRRPFTAAPTLFAAPLVQRRDGSWCLIGFLNREPEGIDAMEIVDPIGVHLEDGYLVADEPG